MPRVTRKTTDQYALKHMFKVNEKDFCDGAVFIELCCLFWRCHSVVLLYKFDYSSPTFLFLLLFPWFTLHIYVKLQQIILNYN